MTAFHLTAFNFGEAIFLMRVRQILLLTVSFIRDTLLQLHYAMVAA